MNSHEDLLNTFYAAFQKKDFQTMKNCYHPRASFSDEVFQNLNATEVGMMWEMLIKSGKDLKIEFGNIQADDQKGRANWQASYTFSRTQKKVLNKIQGEFSFLDGKILTHRDHFNFYAWSRQAFGFTGFMLGWTGFFRNKVRKNALERLKQFSSKQASH